MEDSKTIFSLQGDLSSCKLQIIKAIKFNADKNFIECKKVLEDAMQIIERIRNKKESDKQNRLNDFNQVKVTESI